jgi:hypothetical protein
VARRDSCSPPSLRWRITSSWSGVRRRRLGTGAAGMASPDLVRPMVTGRLGCVGPAATPAAGGRQHGCLPGSLTAGAGLQRLFAPDEQWPQPPPSRPRRTGWGALVWLNPHGADRRRHGRWLSAPEPADLPGARRGAIGGGADPVSGCSFHRQPGGGLAGAALVAAWRECRCRASRPAAVDLQREAAPATAGAGSVRCATARRQKPQAAGAICAGAAGGSSPALPDRLRKPAHSTG